MEKKPMNHFISQICDVFRLYDIYGLFAGVITGMGTVVCVLNSTNINDETLYNLENIHIVNTTWLYIGLLPASIFILLVSIWILCTYVTFDLTKLYTNTEQFEEIKNEIQKETNRMNIYEIEENLEKMDTHSPEYKNYKALINTYDQMRELSANLERIYRCSTYDYTIKDQAKQNAIDILTRFNDPAIKKRLSALKTVHSKHHTLLTIKSEDQIKFYKPFCAAYKQCKQDPTVTTTQAFIEEVLADDNPTIQEVTP